MLRCTQRSSSADGEPSLRRYRTIGSPSIMQASGFCATNSSDHAAAYHALRTNGLPAPWRLLTDMTRSVFTPAGGWASGIGREAPTARLQPANADRKYDV